MTPLKVQAPAVHLKLKVSCCCYPCLFVQLSADFPRTSLSTILAAGTAAEAAGALVLRVMRVAAVQIRASSDIKVACLTNLALCCQKEQKFGEALTWCEKALRCGLLLRDLPDCMHVAPLDDPRDHAAA